MNRNVGQTLVLVLWSMGLLTAAMGALVARSTHELRLGQIPLQQLKQKSLAEAGLWHAAAVLKQDNPMVDHWGETWATGIDAASQQDLFTNQPLGEGSFSIEMVDEQSKINLNTAAVDQLARLIEAVAAGAPAGDMASAIVDWRDEPVGKVCAEAQPACHNALLDTVDELLVVPGMTADLYQALKPYVTVYGDGTINVNTASDEVLQALGLPAEWIDQRPFTTSPDPGNPMLTVTSTYFTVSVDAKLNSTPTPLTLSAVIDREGHILAWHP